MTVTSAYYLEVNGVPLETYAWQTVRPAYDELLNTPALRGEDVVMPDAVGVRSYPRIITVTTVSIPLIVIGSKDQNGTLISDEFAGMLGHRDYLRANLGIADDGDVNRGTVGAIFHRGSLDQWAGDVTVLGLNGWTTLGQGEALVRLDLSIPDGELTVFGS